MRQLESMETTVLAAGSPETSAPSTQKRGQVAVSVPPIMVAAKLAIYQAMRAIGLTRSDLARGLRCDPKQVRRLFDPDHNSRFDHLEAALSALGKKLVVDVRDAA